MNLLTLATELHDKTGMVGHELEVAVFLTASIYAEIMGNKNATDYFKRRMNESAAKIA